MAQEEFINSLSANDFESKIPQFRNDLVNPDIGLMNRVMGGSFIDEMPRETTREITQDDFASPIDAEASAHEQRGKRQQRTISKQLALEQRPGGQYINERNNALSTN